MKKTRLLVFAIMLLLSNAAAQGEGVLPDAGADIINAQATESGADSLDDAGLIDELDEKTLEEVSDEIITDDDVNDEISTIEEDPGAIPGDGVAWAFKRVKERVGLAFTFNSKAKAEKELVLAKLRLLEAKKAALLNRLDAIEKSESAYEKLIRRVRERAASSYSEDGLRGAVLLEARLRKHAVISEAIKAKIADSDLSDDEKAKVKERISVFGAKIKDAKTRLKERRKEIKQRIKESQSMSDEEADDLEEEAEIEAEAVEENFSSPGQKVSAEQFISMLDKKITEAEERTTGLENASEAQSSIELAKEMRDEAKTALEAGKAEKARRLAKEARKLIMRGIIRSRLKSAVIDERAEAGETANEIRNELKDILKEKREKLSEIREKHREESEDLRERLIKRAGKAREDRREMLWKAIENLNRSIKEKRRLREDDEEVRDERINDERTDITQRVNDSTEQVGTAVKERTSDKMMEAEATEAENDSGTQEDSVNTELNTESEPKDTEVAGSRAR